MDNLRDAQGTRDVIEVRLPVAYLVKHLDPQYHVDDDEEREDWQVTPDWSKVASIARDMRSGHFDKAGDSDGYVHLHLTPSGAMIENGNHRVLGADMAGLTHLDVTVTTTTTTASIVEALREQGVAEVYVIEDIEVART